MTLEQAVLNKLRHLPPDKQQEVLQFIESLQTQAKSNPPRRSVKGLWSHLNKPISDEEITLARQEMWSSFPRDIS